ncbi:Hypothetical protein, putative, partial [Bodo saltans]
SLRENNALLLDMKKAPRRPQGQSGPAQSGAALEKVGGYVDPNQTELLASFLGGTQVAEDRENGINVSLRLMNKVSETTKMKALTDLQGRVADVSDDALAPYIPAMLDCVRTHVDHESVQLRVLLFDLLRTIVKKGKPVKQQLAAAMASLIGPWVASMNDMESAVRTSATAAFHECFPEDKRTAVVVKFATDAATFSIERIKDICDTCTKPLLDDTADPKSNMVYSSLGALSMLMRQAPATHSSVLEFIGSTRFAKSLAPARTLGKNALLLRTPRARSAVLALLKDVVDLCPLDAKRHNQIAAAVSSSLFDCDVSVARKTWDLLCGWAKKHGNEATRHFPPKFLDEVIDALLACTVPETVEAQMDALLPFVAIVSKDDRCGGSVLDEFCGALVEKVKLMEETPNISATEMGTVWRALLELWELLCLRKRDEGKKDEAGQELFAVMLQSAVSLVQTQKKATRYLKPLAELIAKSVVRVFNRDASVAVPMLGTLTHDPTAMLYAAIPSLAEGAEEAGAGPSSTEVSPATSPTTHPQLSALQTLSAAVLAYIGEHKSTIAHPSVTAAVNANSGLLLHRCIAERHATAILQFSLDVALPLRDEADATALGRFAIDVVQREVAAEEATPHNDASKLLRLALGTTVGHAADLIRSALSDVSAAWVRDLLHGSLSSDPRKLLNALLDAVAQPLVDGELVERLAAMLIEAPPNALSSEDLAVVCSTVERGLRSLLGQVTFSEEDSNSHSQASDSEASDEESASVSGEENDEDDTSSSSASSSSEDSSNNDDAEDVENKGSELLSALLRWMELLLPDNSLMLLMYRSDEAPPVESWAQTIYTAWVALGPQLQLDHYASDGLIRISHNEGDATSSTDSSPEHSDEAPMDVLEALDLKKHWVRASDMAESQEALEGFIEVHGIDASVTNQWATELFHKAMFGEATSFGGCGPLAHIFAIATPDALVETVGSPDTWTRLSIPMDVDALQDPAALHSGEVLLGGVDAKKNAITAVVRIGQLLKLCEASPFQLTSMKNITPTLCTAFLSALAFRSAFSDTVQHYLVWTLLRNTLASIDDYSVVVRHLAESNQWQLVATMGAALSSIVQTAKEHPSASAAHIVQVVQNAKAFTRAVFEHVFVNKSVAAVQQLSSLLCTPVIGLLEGLYRLATLIDGDVLFDRPHDPSVLSVLHQVVSAPATPSHVVLACLAILRHTAQKDALPDLVTEQIRTQVIPKKSAHEGLAIIGELMCSRVVSRALYMELPHFATALLVQSYALQHLPSNGRLGQRPPGRGGIPTSTLIPIARAVRSILRGMRLHSASDDVLRSSTHLVLFDMICAGVAALQQISVAKGASNTTQRETESVVLLLACVAEQLQRVSTADVKPLRSSTQSVSAIATVFHATYQWLTSLSIARLESLGGDNVRSLLCAVCSLVHLRTRVNVTSPARRVLTSLRRSVRATPIVPPARIRRCVSFHDVGKAFRKFVFEHRVDCERRTRHYPRLLSSVGYLHELVSFNKEVIRTLVYQLCDLILCLSLAPMHPGSRELLAPPIDDDLLGYDLLALTRVHDVSVDQSMSLLARGGVSVLTLLLQSEALPLVKYWVETVDKRQRESLLGLIEHHISPALIQESLSNVLSHSPSGDATFKLEDDGPKDDLSGVRNGRDHCGRAHCASQSLSHASRCCLDR